MNGEILSAKGKELFYKKASRTAASYLRRLEEIEKTPKELFPFFNVLRRVFVEMKAPYGKTDQKMVGTFCAMVPNELIYAAGAYPVRLCSGSFTAYAISEGAKNVGICRAFEEELMREVHVAKYPQFNGAIGAALIASERGRQE